MYLSAKKGLGRYLNQNGPTLKFLHLEILVPFLRDNSFGPHSRKLGLTYQTHRVGRVPSFFPVVGNWDFLTRRRVCPLWFRGGAHSLAAEGVGESQFRRGDILCGTLYVLCGQTIPLSVGEVWGSEGGGWFTSAPPPHLSPPPSSLCFSHEAQTYLQYTIGGFIKDVYCSWVQYKSGPGGGPSM